MPDPALGSAAQPSATRRDRRAGRRRDRRRRVVAFGAAIVILVALGLVATETVRFGGGDRPTLAGAAHAGGRTAGSTTSSVTTVPSRPCRTPLTDADPLRLWIGGDSLAGSLGPSLGLIAGATGVVQPQFDSRVSSGLSNPTFFDWPKQAEKEMARLNPEIAVFIIGANDYAATQMPPTTSVGQQEPQTWKVDYANRVERMIDLLDATDRTVIWVGPPPFKNEKDNASIEQISEVSKEVVARHPDAVFVDDYRMFLDENGKYTDKRLDENGNLVTVRSGDGVHFTTEGGRQLARAVYALIDAQCRVSAQAVPGVTKATIQTEGSTLVAPGSNNRQGGTVATTPPATAPATTAPRAPATTAAPPPATTSAPPPTTAAPAPPPPPPPPPPSPPTTASPPTSTT
jgi:hypothetical protein